MEVEFSSLITILLSFFIIIILLLKESSRSKTITKKLPPGPRKVPLIGHLHHFATYYPLHRKLRDLALKYGSSIMHLQLGEISTVVVSSPEVAKEIMKTHDITFASRPSLLGTEILFYGNTDIAFSPYGEYWRKLRIICTSELLSIKRIQSLRPVREEEFTNLCRWLVSKAGSSINLTERVELTTYDVITRSTLGKKNDEQAAFVSVLKEAIELGTGFQICDVYPSIKLFRKISMMRYTKMRVKLDNILGSIINEHKLAHNEGKKHEDLLDVLLKFHDDGCELPLTTDNIKAILFEMFSGGTETTAATLDWALSEMLKLPRVLKKAQDEVRKVFNEKRYVDESYLHELKYLKLVIKETFRMHPPLPLLLPRENSEHCEVDGYEIPAKTRVLVNAWAIGRDSKHWKEPERFEPERHLEKSVDYRGNNFEFTPFGSGRRICPGINFGLANVELPLAMLLFHFDWILPNGMKPEELDMTDTFGATTRRKIPLCVIPVVKIPLLVK